MNAFFVKRFEHRFEVDGRKIVCVLSGFQGRLFVDSIGQVVKRPRAYGEVQRRLWPRATPNAIARAALAYLGASNKGLIAEDRVAALTRAKGGAA